MKNLKILYLLLIALPFNLSAQDLHFTQFYAAPTYLNPAFTGANACSRLSTNYRNQWPAISKGYVSYALSYDHYVPSSSSGFGFLFTRDQAGSGQLRSTSYSGLYAYEAQLTKKMAIRLGMQATGTFTSLNFYDLIFGDQLSRGGAATSLEDPSVNRTFYFDVSSGLLLFSENTWLGFAAHHLNMPNQSLIEDESPLPVKYSLHGGYKLYLKSKSGNKNDLPQYISPAFNYKAQGKFDQVDLGLYYSYMQAMLGVWYRGIPLFKAYEPGYGNSDAIAILAGFTVEKLQFGYSYDFTISKLRGSTSGAHELSLTYQFCTLKKKKSRKKLLVPCPKF